MSKREWKLCKGFHHIATVIGLLTGIINYAEHRGSIWKKNALLIYIMSQVWAAVKIAAALLSGTDIIPKKYDNMQKSYENIHTLCNDKKKERRYTWFLSILSASFKIGTPILLK